MRRVIPRRKENEAKVTAALDIINLLSVALRQFEKFIVMLLCSVYSNPHVKIAIKDICVFGIS